MLVCIARNEKPRNQDIFVWHFIPSFFSAIGYRRFILVAFLGKSALQIKQICFVDFSYSCHPFLAVSICVSVCVRISFCVNVCCRVAKILKKHLYRIDISSRISQLKFFSSLILTSSEMKLFGILLYLRISRKR